jgi:hypothetical protein
MLTVAADDDDRTEYLNRAKAFLKQKYPVRVAAIQGAHRFLSLTLG